MIDIKDEAQFKAALAQAGDKPLVVEFWAPWCGPCAKLRPILEEIEKKFPDAVFGRMNVEDDPVLTAQFGVRSLPTILIFHGLAVDSITGLVDRDAIVLRLKDLTI